MNALRIMSCVVAFVCTGAVSANAQTFGDIVSQANRIASKTVKSAGNALKKTKTRATTSSSSQKTPARKSQNPNLRLAEAPPVPQRRPRSWLKTTQRTATTRTDNPAAKTNPQPAPANAKPTAAPPKPDQWTPVETTIAHARCQHLLKQLDAVTIPQPAMKKGPCGDAAPVKLVSIGRSPQVAVSPPAIINCQMVHALHTWLEQDLQPLAKKHLGAPIVTIENMSSYSCRNAYGRKKTRLSEHGRANALDIRGFVTANAKHTRLLANWGPTRRDIARAKKKAEDKARLAAKKKAEEKARAVAAKKSTSESKKDTANAVVPPPVRGAVFEGIGDNAPGETGTAAKMKSSQALGLAPSRLGGPKSKTKSTMAAASQKSALRASNTNQTKFLRAAHVSACKLFGTVLGPEANNAHRNHFHVDLAERKRSNFCE